MLISERFTGKKKRFVSRIAIYVSLVLFVSVCIIQCQGKEKQPPNIILILADDLGWADVSYQGSQYHETLHIDNLAQQGIRFTNAYSNAANCAPTRASILSGQYTPRHGVLTVHDSDRGDKKAQKLVPVPNKMVLDTATFSMAEMLSTAGYHTAFIGKWHIGNHKETSPLTHGFDYSLAAWEAGSPGSYFSPYRNPALPDGPAGEYLTDRLTSEAINYLKLRREESVPFFLYLSYYAVHAPYQAKDSLVAKYENKPAPGEQNNPVYAAMIENLDHNIGRIHGFLKHSGQLESTVLVFWSDNGGSFRATVNTPLKGAKGMPWEGGIRVPAFYYAPGCIKEPRIVETPVISTDLYPTFARLAGTQVPDNYLLDGQDLNRLITGDRDSDRSLFWYAPVYLPENKEYAFRMCPSAVIRKGDYKLIWWYENGQTELYNLREDISETNDLSVSQPEIRKILLSELQEWHVKTGARVPSEANPLYDSNHVSETYDRIHY